MWHCCICGVAVDSGRDRVAMDATRHDGRASADISGRDRVAMAISMPYDMMDDHSGMDRVAMAISISVALEVQMRPVSWGTGSESGGRSCNFEWRGNHVLLLCFDSRGIAHMFGCSVGRGTVFHLGLCRAVPLLGVSTDPNPNPGTAVETDPDPDPDPNHSRSHNRSRS